MERFKIKKLTNSQQSDVSGIPFQSNIAYDLKK